jgi:hypothetical protein
LPDVTNAASTTILQTIFFTTLSPAVLTLIING